MLAHGVDRNVEENIVSEILFSYGYDEMVLEKVNQLCEQAMLCASVTSSWIKRIRFFQQRANKLSYDLGAMKAVKHKCEKNYKFKNSSRIKDEFRVDNAINLLLEQREKGYPELKHWMAFLHIEGFTAKDEYLGGDVFQRAFILSLILEMKGLGIEIDPETIEKEIEYLVGMKSRFFEVGWSYYPDLPELSPDIDTLSEMIKIWVSTGVNKKLKEYIDSAIDFVLKNCQNNGAFNTWILDENDESDTSVKALKAAKEMWGTEPDQEVNANFLYALSLLDYEKYKAVIESGIGWLLEMQKEEGYWESTWYVGNYYGCYISSKLFKQLGIINEKIETMINYIKGSQNSNGSWGEDNGNALDTSYALSVLIDIAEGQEINSIIEKGMTYLLNSQNEFGFWTGCDFIKMNMGRVSGNTRIVTYKSAILTSAICIDAIVKKHYC